MRIASFLKLCRQKYGEKGEFKLETAALMLGAGKRRLYDIVNVLESLGMINKLGKNRYEWVGTSRFAATIRQIRVR